MSQPLGRDPIAVSIPVAWGDMDAFQHVNNVAYARWIETARVAYFTRLGLMNPLRADGIGPILARLSIDYGRALTYPDTVRVQATVRSIGKSSLTMGYRLWSAAQQAEVASGEDVVVVFHYQEQRKATVDEQLRRAIHDLEATAPAAHAELAPV